MVHDRTFDDQRLRAGGLNLVVAAIVFWNTVYLEPAVATLRAAGLEVQRSCSSTPRPWAGSTSS